MHGKAATVVAPAAPAHAHLDARMRELHALVESGDFDVLSLDVFDTFVFREAPRPTDVFFHLAVRLREQGRLWPSSSPESFVRERIAAEQRARARKHGHEVTLEEIWAEFPGGYFAAGGAAAAVEAEIECEARVVRVVPAMRDLASRARTRGLKIAFVSDTYFSRRAIARFTGFAADHVVLSCDHGCPKALGLHRVLLEKCHVPPARILHVGDSHAADVAGPEALGIARFWLRHFPGEYDGLLERELPDALSRRAPLVCAPDGGLTGLRAQTMHASAPGHERWGAGVLGPALAGYADWVATRCEELGISTVLCLMREGTVIKSALDATGAPLRAHEAYVSRYAALRAAIVHGTVAEIARFVLRPTPQKVATILGQLGLTAADAPGCDLDARVEGAEARRFVESLANRPETRRRIVAASAAARKRLLRHLEPMLPSHGVVAIADLGYKGTIQMALQEALDAERSHIATHGLYLVTGGNVHETQATGAHVEGWLAENGQPIALAHTFMRSPEIFEQGLMADCGTTLGHADDGAPVLDETHIPASQRAEIAAVQRGAARFLARWHDHHVAHGPADGATMRELCRAIVVRAVARPLPVELEMFAHWIHDENFGSGAARALTDVVDEHDWERTHRSAHQLASLPSGAIHWPFGRAWSTSATMGETVACIFLRQAEPLAFAGAGGPRPMVVSWDDGSGWSDEHSRMVEFVAGADGTCWHRVRLAHHSTPPRAVAFGLGGPGDIVRLDGARIHWRPGRGEARDATVAAAELLVHGADALAPGLYRVGEQPLLVALELPEGPGGDGIVDVDLFFSLLPGA